MIQIHIPDLLLLGTERYAETRSILELKKEVSELQFKTKIFSGVWDNISTDKEIEILPSPKQTLYSSGA